MLSVKNHSEEQRKVNKEKEKNNREKLNVHLLFLHFISWLLTTLIKVVYQCSTRKFLCSLFDKICL
jgi:Co/Zn/Cd efflux system component